LGPEQPGLGLQSLTTLDRQALTDLTFLPILVSFHHYYKIPEKNNLKDGKFHFGLWFQVLGHGCLALLLGACNEAEHHGDADIVSRAAPLMAARKQSRVIGRDQGKGAPFKGMTRDPTSPTRPAFHSSTTSQ
jgi:hypothetical protein